MSSYSSACTKYRERLNTKYDDKPPLIASSWTFIKDGIDDFRDGQAPSIDSSTIIKGHKGIRPTLFGADSSDGKQVKQRIKKDLSKDDVVYSKCAPGQKKRKDHVELIEKKLLNHPLALHPHIEDAVPPDLFEDIIELLDPSLMLTEDNEFNEEDLPYVPAFAHISDDQTNKDEKRSATGESPREACSGYNIALRCEKRYNEKLTMNQVEDVYLLKDEKQPKKANQGQTTKIEDVTNEFCDWVRGLGGEAHNIGESTVSNLFASGYDTKPTLSVPVHVVELTNVPPELRADARLTENQESALQQENTTSSASYTPSWVKVKYGAWYLDPKTWKARRADEPLQDPKEIEGNVLSEARKKSKEMDKVLSTLHGAKSFRTFIENKGARTPEFLDGVSNDESDDTSCNDV